jgi:RNA polymerase sigma factor (sigma-70 family)
MTTITFETVLTEQIGPLTWRATRMVGDAQTAEDLRQETLARAWRSAPRDMPAPALRAWLHRTTTNLALDELRRRRRRDEVALTEVAGGRSDVEPEAREALATLTAHERLVLLLRHEAGLSLRELGEVLDIS